MRDRMFDWWCFETDLCGCEGEFREFLRDCGFVNIVDVSVINGDASYEEYLEDDVLE